jgi:hypothetical protein
MRDPLASVPDQVNRELFQIALKIDEQWPDTQYGNDSRSLSLPKQALSTLRAWLEKPAQAEIRSMWWQGLAFIQPETPMPIRQALVHHLIQDTLTHFGLRLIRGDSERLRLKVVLPGNGPGVFSALYVECSFLNQDAEAANEAGLANGLARLFNAMITYAYELRLREKPWSTP